MSKKFECDKAGYLTIKGMRALLNWLDEHKKQQNSEENLKIKREKRRQKRLKRLSA